MGRNTRALFIGPRASVEKVSEWGFPSSRIVETKPYQSNQVGDFKITALPALDTHLSGALTYMFEACGFTIFHAGDSVYFNELLEFGKKWSVDLALLGLGRNPLGDTYYMTPCDVVRAAEDLGAKIVVPMHWDLWKRVSEDPRLVEVIADEWQTKTRVVILRLGDRFEKS